MMSNPYIWTLVAANVLAIATVAGMMLYTRHNSWERRVERQYQKEFEEDWADGYATLLEKWVNKTVAYIEERDDDIDEPIDLMRLFEDELVKDLYHFMSEYCLCQDAEDFDDVVKQLISDFQEDLNILLGHYYGAF
jgi:hypothetical protein